MQHLVSRFSFIFIASLAVLLWTGCPSDECQADADCTDGVCSEGICVGCNTNSDCGADAFCCQSECLSDASIEANCGCEPKGLTAGANCSGDTNICTVGTARATVDTIAEAECGCPCDATGGGSICTVDTESQDGYICGCEDGDNRGTCGGPVLDNDNNPHEAANVCSPINNTCLCLSETGPCGTGGLPPDCSTAGCVTLRQDSGNCGVGGNNCKEPTRGLDDGMGVCVDGGCQCDVASDCVGAGLNVDSCALVGDAAINRCVCTDYKDLDDNQAACPLEMECVDGGCDYYGQIVPNEAALFTLLGVQVQSTSDAGQ